MVHAEGHLEAIGSGLTAAQYDAGIVDQHRERIGLRREHGGELPYRIDRREVECTLLDIGGTAAGRDVGDGSRPRTGSRTAMITRAP